MAKILSHVIPAAAAVVLLVCFAQATMTMEQELKNTYTWIPMKAAATKGTSSWCKGSGAECLASGGKLEMMWMDSETNRRILGTESKYISYGALQRNTVPCSVRGASYYNCRPGAEVNPYTRGCSAITRCRS